LKANIDLELWKSSTRVCGIDEVGRGALAGPVVAAAVVLPAGCELPDADDSKRLSRASRERVADEVRAKALAVSIAAVGARTIDRINIRQATLLAMRRAFSHLAGTVDMTLVDGLDDPGVEPPCRPIVGGDGCSLTIACASIAAKVFRDRLMAVAARSFPGYGFATNAGYGTPEHLTALHRVGPSPLHRLTFAPVRSLRTP
jgi:ribonuclease HII